MVTQKRYRAIFLTADWWKMAAEVKRRHQIVENFLRALDISAETSRIESEGIEHHVSEETLKAMAKYIARKER